MDREVIKNSKKILEADSSFEKDINTINNNFHNKYFQNQDFKSENEKKIPIKDKYQNNFDNKYFEEATEEIYVVLNEINPALIIDVNTTNQKYYNKKKKRSYSHQNKKITNEEHLNECQEILSILKKTIHPFQCIKK